MKKHLLFLTLLLMATTYLFSQKNETDELFAELKIKDSLLFKLGFNQCDTGVLRILINDDFEFYHDQGGLMTSKEDFLRGIPNLCNMNYKPTRVLIDSTLQVFPLYSNGQLYGAIQKGVHEFYGEEKGKPKYLTSTAKFTHVWMLEEKEWKLKRILSYDHQVPN